MEGILREMIPQETLAFEFSKFLFQKSSYPISMLRIPGLRILRMTKGNVDEGRRKDKSVVEEKGKRSAHWTRVGMDFDPKSFVLSSQKEVSDYLMRYHGRLASIIAVEFCPATMDVKVTPLAGGVYFHPQILALGFCCL